MKSPRDARKPVSLSSTECTRCCGRLMPWSKPGFSSIPLARIRVKFLKWVYLDDEATLTLQSGDATDPRVVRVEVQGTPVLSLDLTYNEASSPDAEYIFTAHSVAQRTYPNECSMDDLDNCSGQLTTAPSEAAGASFPHLARFLSNDFVAELAACSYVVGMEVPGLHSMFSKLDITLINRSAVPRGTHGLQFRVSYHDKRFHKARIAVAGHTLTGTLEVFFRSPPATQASMEIVRTHVATSEFAGMHALIVGGSRGLGELTAKIIAAGGGSVTITYARGKTEAEQIANEINKLGGTANALHYDVQQPPKTQLVELTSRVSHLFYFATNPIFRSKGLLVSSPILADFVRFYLQGFHDLCTELMKEDRPYLLNEKKLAAYYPSSVAVEERPAGMTEYSMVKAAGEQMCRDMNQYIPGLQIFVTRLPRLKTDQTAGIVPEQDLDAVSVILSIVRQMKALSREE